MASIISAGTTTGTALSLTSDTSGELQIQTNNGATTAMTLTTGGNVGIGTSSPATKLVVKGTHVAGQGLINIIADSGTQFASLSFTNNVTQKGILFHDNTNNLLNLYGAAGQGLAFTTNDSERMRIDSSGNVGIGTSSPATKLSVVGQGQFNVDANGTGTQLTLINNSQTGTVVTKLAFQNGGAVKASINAAVYNNDFMTFNTGSDTERMRIDSSGNVGIGTTSPSALLTVNGAAWTAPGAPWQGTILAYNTNALGTDVGAGLLLGGVYQSGLTTEFAQIVGAKENATSGNYAGNMIFYTRPNGTTLTERMRINSSGQLLVGTTSVLQSDEKLAVLDSTGLACIISKQTGGSSGWVQKVWNTATSGNNNFVEFLTETSLTARGSITYNRGAGLTAYGTTSDYRAKDIISPVLNSGELIDSVPVYMGKMKGATQARPMFIAHETPDYAHTGEKDAVDKDGNPVYQQMDASSLVPVLWAEIQSLRKRVAQLESK